MIITKYGLRLERLTEKDLELVRLKRNSDAIRNKMIYQKIISEEEQLKWFHSIDNVNNIYLIVHYDGKKIGMINGKNTDFTNRISEGGIFIWEEKYLQSVVPAFCAVIMHDYNFLICEFEKTLIKVLNSNTAAIQFNKMFGYIPSGKMSDSSEFTNYELTRDNYFQKINKYRSVIGSHTGDKEPLGEKDFSFQNTSDENIERLYGPLPLYLREKVNIILRKENRKLLNVQ